ncbi:DUF3667 domain-containing protein [Flavobacterium sp.]|uniref:DUF3667 domain-containing protein n=1 Tax=Flavobacterium sp. TaxID=239 RepID=UPI00391AC581
MAHKNPLRKDKTCLNCNYVVEQRFCPNCGQENTDTRKTFYHLFVHFFEDLTHYENAFWKTIRNLILKPAALTKEYLSGKRLSYLAPVRLYIFISFVTFFMFNILANKEEQLIKNETKTGILKDTVKLPEEVWLEEIAKDKRAPKAVVDSLKQFIRQKKEKDILEDDFMNFGYHSLAEMDSVRQKDPDAINALEYWINKKSFEVKKRYPASMLPEKFKQSVIQNIPKALFLYMPIFALVLWLFHNKKRWYYFDQGIFTLHYFSFLLLINLIVLLVDSILSGISSHFLVEGISGFFALIAYLWMFNYFFPAQHRFYGESRLISFLNSMALLFINMILISFLLVFLFVYSFVNIH